MNGIISGWTVECDHYQAMFLLQADGVPVGAVLKASQTKCPQLEAGGFWNVVDKPEAGR